MFKKIKKKLNFRPSIQKHKNYERQTNTKTLRRSLSKLDLNHFSSCADNIFLDEILNELKLNSSIGYIEENNRINYFKANSDNRINLIHNQLIQNIQSYDYFPNSYTYCLLANHCYCLNNNNNNLTESEHVYKSKSILVDNQNIRQDDDEHADFIWQILKSQNWIIYETFKSKGFKSVIYLNEHSKQLVLAIQGFKFHMSTFFIKKYESYIESIIKLIHQNIYFTLFHMYRSIRLSQELNYSLSFTGYSFGAILADLCVYLTRKYFKLNRVKSVKFDPIGSFKILNDLNSSAQNQIDLNQLDLESYLSEFNFMNTCETQSGQMFSVSLNSFQLNSELENSTEFDKIDDLFVTNGLKCLDSFNLKLMLVDLSKKKCVNHKILKWPTHSTIQSLKNINFKIYEFNESHVNMIDHTVYNKISNYLINCMRLVFQFCNQISRGESIRTIEYSLETKILFNDKRLLNLESNHIDKILFVLSLTDLTHRKDLLCLHLKNLKNLYLINYNLEEDNFIIMKTSEIQIDKIIKICERILKFYPHMLSLIEISKQTVELFKYVYKQRVQLLKSINLKNHINKNSEFIINKQINLLTSQHGSGKREFCQSYALKRLDQETNLVVKFIDSSTNCHILIDLDKFTNELNINFSENNKRNIFDCIKEKLNSLNNLKFLLIFFNVKDFNFIQSFYNGFNSNVQLILTTNSNYESEDYKIYSTRFYMFTNKDYLDLFQKYSTKLNYLIETNNLTINDLVSKLKAKTILKVKTVLNCLVNNVINNLDEFLKLHNNILGHVCENLVTLKFLQTCSLLDCNHLELSLLRIVYSLDNDLDEEEFNNLISYLTKMCILNQISSNEFKLHEFFKQSLQINLNDKVKIANALLPKLVNLNMKTEVLYKHVVTVLDCLLYAQNLDQVKFKTDNIFEQLRQLDNNLFNLIVTHLSADRYRIAINKNKPKYFTLSNMQFEREQFIESTRYLFSFNYVETEHLLELFNNNNNVIKARNGQGKTTLCVKHALNRLQKEPNLMVKFLDKSSEDIFDYDVYKLATQFDIEYKDNKELFKKLNKQLKSKDYKILFIVDNLSSIYSAGDLKSLLNTDHISSVFSVESFDIFTNLNEAFLKLAFNNCHRLYHLCSKRLIDFDTLQEFVVFLFTFRFAKHLKPWDYSLSSISSIVKLLQHNQNWKLEDLNSYMLDKFGFIRIKNMKSFQLLHYLAELNGEYLNFNLLSNLFELVHQDSNSLNNTIGYLIKMNILIPINRNRFRISRLIKNELVRFFNFMPKLRTKFILLKALNKMLTNLDKSKWSIFDENVEICFKQLIYLDVFSSNNDLVCKEKAQLIQSINNIDNSLGLRLQTKEISKKVYKTSVKNQLSAHFQKKIERINDLISNIDESIALLENRENHIEYVSLKLKYQIFEVLHKMIIKIAELNCSIEEKNRKKQELHNNFTALAMEIESYHKESIENFKDTRARDKLFVEARLLINKLVNLKELCFKYAKDEFGLFEIDQILVDANDFFQFEISLKICSFVFSKGIPKLVDTDYENLYVGQVRYQ